MSSIQTEIIRLQDKLCIKATLVLTWKEDGECSIEFRHNNQPLEILYCTEGSIYDGKLHLARKKSPITATLEYQPGVSECIMSYLTDKHLQSHENVQFELEELPQIETAPLIFEQIKSINSGFMNRLQNLSAAPDKTWRLLLEIKENIIIRVIKAMPTKAFIAFGEQGLLRESDFIFPIYPGTSKLTIPKEVVWKKHNLYDANARLGCFLIAQADFHKIKHLFYKVLISNTLALSEIPKIKSAVELNSFKTPLGEYFDQYLWIVRNQLPVRL